jgi:hypothetical protein
MVIASIRRVLQVLRGNNKVSRRGSKVALNSVVLDHAPRADNALVLALVLVLVRAVKANSKVSAGDASGVLVLAIVLVAVQLVVLAVLAGDFLHLLLQRLFRAKKAPCVLVQSAIVIVNAIAVEKKKSFVGTEKSKVVMMMISSMRIC